MKNHLMIKLLILSLLIIVMVLIFKFDVFSFLSLEALRENRVYLLEQVDQAPILSAIIFTIVYALSVAVSVPGALILTLAGGFLFGTFVGAFLVITGATIGACLVFLVARSTLGSALKKKAGPWIERIETEFQQNGVSYLLVLRLVPIFPFWLVNLVPAFLGVGLGMFAVTTFFGILPGSLVYASVGNGLGEIFELGGEPNLSIITDPAILGPLIGLALLACVPMIYKRFFKSK